MNGAGRFDDLDEPDGEQSTDEVSVTLTGKVAQKPAEAWTLSRLMDGPLELAQKATVYVSFMAMKQPSRIRSVLNNVRVQFLTTSVQPKARLVCPRSSPPQPALGSLQTVSCCVGR